MNKLSEENKKVEKTNKVKVDINLKKVLTEAVSNVNLFRCKTNLDKTKQYQRALQECLEGQYPGKDWHEITNCDIYATLCDTNNNLDETINKILVESKLQPEKPEKKAARKLLNEGASNFRSMRRLPLLVFEDYETIMDRVHDAAYEQLEDDEAFQLMTADEQDEKLYELEDKIWDTDYKDVCVLDEDGVSRLKDDIEEHNRKMKYKYYYDREEDEWSGEEVEIKPGYYEAAQLYIDDNPKYMSDEEFNDHLKFFEEMRDKYGLEELEVAYRFSNGETGYNRVKKECLTESANCDSVEESLKESDDQYYIGWAKTSFDEFRDWMKNKAPNYVIYSHDGKWFVAREVGDGYSQQIDDRMMPLIRNDEFLSGRIVESVKKSSKKKVVKESDCEVQSDSLKEDTVKQGSQWVNKGKEGTHGKFKTKKEADAQRKAMFASGYKAEGLTEAESLEEKVDNELMNPVFKTKGYIKLPGDSYPEPLSQVDIQNSTAHKISADQAKANLKAGKKVYKIDPTSYPVSVKEIKSIDTIRKASPDAIFVDDDFAIEFKDLDTQTQRRLNRMDDYKRNGRYGSGFSDEQWDRRRELGKLLSKRDELRYKLKNFDRQSKLFNFPPSDRIEILNRLHDVENEIRQYMTSLKDKKHEGLTEAESDEAAYKALKAGATLKDALKK